MLRVSQVGLLDSNDQVNYSPPGPPPGSEVMMTSHLIPLSESPRDTRRNLEYLQDLLI